MLALNTKVNTDYILSSCWQLAWYLFLEKIVNYSEIWTQQLFCLKWKHAQLQSKLYKAYVRLDEVSQTFHNGPMCLIQQYLQKTPL